MELSSFILCCAANRHRHKRSDNTAFFKSVGFERHRRSRSVGTHVCVKHCNGSPISTSHCTFKQLGTQYQASRFFLLSMVSPVPNLFLCMPYIIYHQSHKPGVRLLLCGLCKVEPSLTRSAPVCIKINLIDVHESPQFFVEKVLGGGLCSFKCVTLQRFVFLK